MTMRSASPPFWIGLDIGGANLKAAHSLGPVCTVPFELWKRPADLPRMLGELLAGLPLADRFGVTMTAESCDCFATKAQGVEAVLAALMSVVPEPAIRVWCTDERLHSVRTALEKPEIAASSNWLALATAAARLAPKGPALLIDVGSTTTDLIPLHDGRPVPRGRTDTQRLQTGELVYAGIMRTPICALVTELPWREAITSLTTGLFATTLDAYLTLGELPEDQTDPFTADHRPRTIAAARARLARMVGADGDSFSPSDAEALSRAVDAALTARLIAHASRACRVIGQPETVIVAGSGDFLARRIARRIMPPHGTIIELREAWGKQASVAACARALVELATRSEVIET